jgi:hypothetical protein
MAGLIDYNAMVQQLMGQGLLSQVASPGDFRKKGLNPIAATEGAVGYGGGSTAPKWIESFHGTNAGPFTAFRPSEVGTMGKGVYLGEKAIAGNYGSNVMRVRARGELATYDKFNELRDKAIASGMTNDAAKAAAQASLQQQGFRGITTGKKIVIFDPKDVSPID